MSAGVLFVHNNFPAQFADLAGALAARGVPVAAIGAANAPGLPGVKLGRYGLSRGTTTGIFPLAVRAEADLLRATSAARLAGQLKEAGVDPAVIIGHPGWGETLFLHEAWPDAKIVAFSEFYYRGRGLDVGFDTEFFTHTDEAAMRAEAKNAVMSMALLQADVIVAPTEFQASVLPAALRPLVRVIHEGVDTEAIRPQPPEPFELAEGQMIWPGATVITYVNNNMEPLRGLHIFARALPRLMAEVPEVQVLMFGQDNPRPYGGQAADGKTWREVVFEGLEVDPARLHVMGRTDHATMLAGLRHSTAHVYYTYPFVLSWSVVEAMATGCYVIGSDTPPVRDAIEDGVNGKLLPFFDVDALSQAMIEACRNPEASAPLRAAARETAVAKFSAAKGREAWFGLLAELGVEIPS